MLAAILGATIALWFLAGDRDPSATEFIVTCHLSQMDTADFADTQFYALDCGKGRTVVSLDSSLPMAQWFASHRGERISIALGGSN